MGEIHRRSQLILACITCIGFTGIGLYLNADILPCFALMLMGLLFVLAALVLNGAQLTQFCFVLGFNTAIGFSGMIWAYNEVTAQLQQTGIPWVICFTLAQWILIIFLFLTLFTVVIGFKEIQNPSF